MDGFMDIYAHFLRLNPKKCKCNVKVTLKSSVFKIYVVILKLLPFLRQFLIHLGNWSGPF